MSRTTFHFILQTQDPSINTMRTITFIFYDDKEIISDLAILSNFHLESKYFLPKMSLQLYTVEQSYEGGNRGQVWGGIA